MHTLRAYYAYLRSIRTMHTLVVVCILRREELASYELVDVLEF